MCAVHLDGWRGNFLSFVIPLYDIWRVRRPTGLATLVEIFFTVRSITDGDGEWQQLTLSTKISIADGIVTPCVNYRLSSNLATQHRHLDPRLILFLAAVCSLPPPLLPPPHPFLRHRQYRYLSFSPSSPWSFPFASLSPTSSGSRAIADSSPDNCGRGCC